MSKTSLRAGRHDIGAMGDLHASQGCLEAKWVRHLRCLYVGK